MNPLRAPLALCGLLLSLACDPGSDDDDDVDVATTDGSPWGGTSADPQPSGDDARELACREHARTYSDLMTECFAVEDVSDADVASVCASDRDPQSVWYTCVQEVEFFAACGEDVGCESWFGVDCWESYRAMTVCFGQDDPGETPPSCPYTGDGECDEPEGTAICVEGTDVADCEGGGTGGTGGDAPSCDPSACSGCETACDDFGCYQCCWSCNGSSCEQSCNF